MLVTVPDEIPARSALHQLADRHGVATRYENADQEWVEVEDDVVVAVLGQFGVDATSDDAVAEAEKYLLGEPPGRGADNFYYWYYATLALHNVPGPQWDKWNRNMRRILIDTQDKEGCAAGSWNPEHDTWGVQGGRLMVTSLSTLTLEVYYRYLPLYQLDRDDVNKTLNGLSMSAQ